MVSAFEVPLNNFPTTGTLSAPGIPRLLSLTRFFLIPPITTMSPSAIKSFVFISILLIPGVPGVDLFGVSLVTTICNITFPSPIIFGVTVSFKFASTS